MRSNRLPLRNRCHGFSLVEVLVALAILAIAVLGVGVAIGVQSSGTAKSLSFGLGAVSRAGSISTAAFLAQERLEQVKRLRYTIGPPLTDQFGVGQSPAGFPDQGFGTIPVGPGPGCPCYPNFSRQVRFWTGPPQAPAANVKLVTVTVFFNAPGDNGLHQESVAVSTLVAARP